MYAPKPVEPGSTGSHFSDSLAPNQLMEPAYTGPNHELLLASELLRDIGWRTTRGVPAHPAPWAWLAFAALFALGIRRSTA